MIRSILAATDPSHGGEHTLRRASSLAEALGAPLTVLHGAESGLPETIAQTARSLPGCLIVMGECTKTSVIEQVLRSCDTPVIVAKGEQGEPYRRILCAIDGSLPSRRAFNLASALFPDAEFLPLTVVDVPLRTFAQSPADITLEAELIGEARRDAGDLIAQSWQGVAPPPHPVALVGDPVTMLQNFCRDWSADLLATGTHGRSGLAHLLLGSVAKGLLHGAPCDVLTVPLSEDHDDARS